MGASNTSIVRNIGWSVVERLCSQVVYFIVSIVLARLIVPETYGIAMVVTVIINVFAVALPSGFSSALIYSKSDDDIHYSTAFWATMIMTLVLYGVLFIIAPYIAEYYSANAMTTYIRVMAIQLILQGMQSIPFAYVSKKMLFKKNYTATFIGVVVSAFVSVFLAVFGLGIWALLLSISIQTAVATVVLWRSIGFHISFKLDIGIAKTMFLYCWKLMGVDFLNSLYSSLNSLIIGKMFQKAEVAFYTRAYNLPQMLLGSVTTAVSKVLFPVFSEKNNSINDIRQMLRKSIRSMNYMVFPLMAGLGAMGYEVIVLLYTDQWTGAVPYLYIMCLVWAFQPVQTCTIQAFKALGKTGVFLKLEVLKKIVGLAVLGCFIYFIHSPMALAFSLLVSQMLSAVINMPIMKKYLNYSYTSQIKDMFESLPISLLMMCGVLAAKLLVDDLIIRIVCQVAIGVVSYVVLSLVFKNKSCFDVMAVAKKALNRC